jgi:hypothetical protein
MKQQLKSQRWIQSALTGLALAGSTSLCLAADISYTFDADAQGWYKGGGNGTVTWDGTHGFGGSGGCLKITSLATFTDGAFPTVNVAWDTTTMWSIEADIMVESGTGQAGDGNYGNFQAGMFNATWAWDSIWYGSVNGSFVGAYKHIKISRSGGPFEPKAHLQFLIQAAGGAFAADSVIYLDNVVIRVVPDAPAAFVINAFQRVGDATPGYFGFDGTPVATSDWNTTNDAGGGFTPLGSFHVQEPYDGSAGFVGFKAQFNTDWDPSKFSYFDCDVYLEAPTGLSSYGAIELALLSSTYGWNSMGFHALQATNNGVWTHISMPIANAGVGNSSHGYILRGGGNPMPAATFNYYFDNVRVWKPAGPPRITNLQKSRGAGGVQITMDQDASQWQRDAIVTPTGTSYSWVGQTPATYSFTITNFPGAAAHPRFEAHLFFINNDTGPGSWNEIYGGADYNAADLAFVSLHNNTNGSVDLSFSWKTNLPNANPLTNAIYHPASITNLPSALGTWSLTFNSDTSLTLNGPGGVSTNFSLPDGVPASNFNPTSLSLQFGMFKNDDVNDGHNNQQSGTFSRVSLTNSSGVVFDDSFSGPGLTNNYAWRVTSPTAVQWLPAGTAWWLTWTTPDDGFNVKVANNVTGPYSDAGVTYAFLQGANRVGAVPAASIPVGNAAFFQLRKAIPAPPATLLESYETGVPTGANPPYTSITQSTAAGVTDGSYSMLVTVDNSGTWSTIVQNYGASAFADWKNHSKIRFDVHRAAMGAGWNLAVDIALNGDGAPWTQTSLVNWVWLNAGDSSSETLVYDYSAMKAAAPATGTWWQFNLVLRSGQGGDVYIDNIRFTD